MLKSKNFSEVEPKLVPINSLIEEVPYVRYEAPVYIYENWISPIDFVGSLKYISDGKIQGFKKDDLVFVVKNYKKLIIRVAEELKKEKVERRGDLSDENLFDILKIFFLIRENKGLEK